MKKIFFIALLTLALLLSGCLKFTSQSDFEAQQKAASTDSSNATLSLDADSALSLAGDMKTDAQVKAEIEGSLKTIEDGKDDVPQNPTPGEPTPKDAPLPTPSVTIIPLDDIWKAAEFEHDERHSYEINYPDSLNFATGGDTDTFSAATLTNEKGQIAAELRDYSLMGCPDENANCGLDERVARTPEQIAAALVVQYQESDWDFVSKSIVLRQVTKAATQLKNPNGKVMYFIELEKGVLTISLSAELARDTNFVKTLLNSLVSAK